MDFDAAVSAHLGAISRRDLDAYRKTVHDNVTVILPNGRRLSGRDEVLTFHKDWFDDQDWEIELTVTSTSVTGETGIVVLEVAYHDLDAGGTPYSLNYLLSLVFARDEGSWLLVHDQNTLC